MTDIEMPQLGETVTEGTITQWFKQVGDSIAEDEPLFEVSTDKVDSEVPSPVSGTISEILVEEGETVEVGAVLARVGDADSAPEESSQTEEQADESEDPKSAEDESAEEPAEEKPAEEKPAEEEPESRPEPPSSSSSATEGVLLSPVVRRLVNEHDLDPADIEGTGAGGRITRSDVQKIIESGGAGTRRERPEASESAPASQRRGLSAHVPRAGKRDTAIPHSRIRLASASHMIESLATSAHVYTNIEVDFENVERVRQAHKDQFKADEGMSLTYLPFISRAVTDAIREYPHVNASFGPDELIVHDYVNLGIAVDLDFEGLLVPVIADADGKRLRALAREINDLATRARTKKLSPDELAGGSFTITNPGPFGTMMTLPIINQPQVAILSTDAIKRRPVVVEGADGSEAIGIRPVGILTLTWDHRAFDGAYAAAFIKHIKDLLETMDWEQELG